MLKAIIAGLACALAMGADALAQTCPAYTYTLTNGATADASQVMANFNTVRNCVATGVVLRDYIAGLTLSTAGSSATYGVAAGQATNSTNVSYMNLASGYSKTTAAWAVGNAAGSLDTGTITANTWYHVFLIQRPDTGVVDVLLSLSATAPTLPANYTLFRRIGSMKTNASSLWYKFYQIGNQFLWDAGSIVSDVFSGTIPTAPAATVVNVPPGVQVQDLFSISIYGGNIGGTAYLYAQDAPLGGLNIRSAVLASWMVGQTTAAAKGAAWSDLNQHIYVWGSQWQSGAWSWLESYGWIDLRGTNN